MGRSLTKWLGYNMLIHSVNSLFNIYFDVGNGSLHSSKAWSRCFRASVTSPDSNMHAPRNDRIRPKRKSLNQLILQANLVQYFSLCE